VQINGACACGNLTVRITLTKAASNYETRQCLCSFCKARDGLYMSDPLGKFEITVQDEAQLKRHRFATSTADFMICRSCDGYIGAVGETDTGLRGVVNIKCLENPGAFSSKATPHDFDGEVTEDRLARRGRNWTPVIFTRPDAS
jgi:hypothetical protein